MLEQLFPYVGKTYDGYTLIGGIQDTSNSSIYESENQECGKIAIKFIKKDGMSVEACRNEIEINKNVNNPYIIPIKTIINNVPNEFFCGIVMEKAAGCDLLDMLLENDSPLDEKIAVQVAYAGLKALEYLHSIGICHRDIKPENIFLMDDNRQELDVVLADFGHACGFKQGEKMHEFHIGTLMYSAPEILKNEEYDQSVDIWSLGCVIYTILTGYTPFPNPDDYGDSEDKKNCIEMIIEGKVNFEEEIWSTISEDAKIFVESMISVDPKKRPSIKNLLEHKWIKNCYVEHGKQQKRVNRARNQQVYLPAERQIDNPDFY